jgi:hypothetical protein
MAGYSPFDQSTLARAHRRREHDALVRQMCRQAKRPSEVRYLVALFLMMALVALMLVALEASR